MNLDEKESFMESKGQIKWHTSWLGRLDRILRHLYFSLFAGDVLYTVLPIIVYAIVRLTYRRPFHDFLGLPEWSFASIVFYGLSIRRTTELRRAYSSSLYYKLNIRVQVFVFLLIASVLALSLAIVSEDDLGTNHLLIVLMQQVFFWLGIVSLTYTIYTERYILSTLDKKSFYFFWEDILTIADENLYTLLHSISLLDHQHSIIYKDSGEPKETKKERDELRVILQRISNSIDILKEAEKKISRKLNNEDDKLQAKVLVDTAPNNSFNRSAG
jgi:hypothetical protein